MDDAIRNIEEMEEKIRVLTRKKDLLKQICKKAGKEIKELKRDNKLLANDIADMNESMKTYEDNHEPKSLSPKYLKYL
tara:strand:+ start:32 stop:265 length:234 start_codon:yes stop_codon:yes gene_type:complete